MPTPRVSKSFLSKSQASPNPSVIQLGTLVLLYESLALSLRLRSECPALPWFSARSPSPPYPPEPQALSLAPSEPGSPRSGSRPSWIVRSEPALLSPGLLFQVLSVLLSLVGDALVSVYRSEGGTGATQGCSLAGEGIRAGPSEA
jgi:hypothetical protein